MKRRGAYPCRQLQARRLLSLKIAAAPSDSDTARVIACAMGGEKSGRGLRRARINPRVVRS